MKRRDFLRTTAGVLAASALPMACSKPQAVAKKEIPLGVQLYSVRSECAKDFEATVAKVAEIGYQGVEFAGYYDYSAQDMKKILDANGLKCCGTHTQLATLRGDELAKTIEYNQIIGNKYLICPWLNEDERGDADGWKKLGEEFSAIAEKVKTYGMQVGYHNHDFEFHKIGEEYPWDIFATSTSDDVILQLDTCNCMMGGADPMEFLKKYPGRTTTVHIKEYSATKPDAILGEGDVPFKEVFEVCETTGGTEWYIIEEEKDAYPPLVAIEKCYNNFKSLKA